MFLQTLVPWINDVGVDVLSDPRAAGDSRPYESIQVNRDKVHCPQGKRRCPGIHSRNIAVFYIQVLLFRL